MRSAANLIDESYTLRRLGRRLGYRPGASRPQPPERPVGVKLEVTYHCNLRCGFCYTDSPRRTLERSVELSDDAWRRVVGEAIDIGVIEAVITGGEPLLRRDLVLETAERLDAADISVTMNTNGWFVDEEIAERLGAIDAMRVHLSIDGVTPQLHDASRGVPGSWRRVVRAVHLLLERGVRVQVVHVVTPRNERTLPTFLEQMWTLGVRSLRLSPVVRVGAASRSGEWAVDRRRLRRAVAEFEARHGDDDLVIRVQAGNAGLLASRDDVAPAALLVRPNGAVLADSLHPFAFGDIRDQTLSECWEGLRAHWRDEEISRWAAAIPNARQLGRAKLVPYRDEEVAVGFEPKRAPNGERDAEGAEAARRRVEKALELMKSKSPDFPEDGVGDLDGARDHVRDLTLSRRYRLGDIRWSGDGDGPRFARVRTTQRTHHLNRTASMVMDACAGGTPADAVAMLQGRFPSAGSERLVRDVVGAVRRLSAAGILATALGPRRDPAAEEPLASGIQQDVD